MTTFRDLLQQGHVRRGRRGLPPATGEPWSWDQFVEAAKALTKPEANSGRVDVGRLRLGPVSQLELQSIAPADGTSTTSSATASSRRPSRPTGSNSWSIDPHHKVTPTPARTGRGCRLLRLRPGGDEGRRQFAHRQTSQTPISRSLSGLPVGREARGDGGSGFTMSASTKQAMRRGGG